MENSEQIYEVTLPNGIVIKSKEVCKAPKEELQKLGFKYTKEIDILSQCFRCLDMYITDVKEFHRTYEDLNKLVDTCISLAYEMGAKGYPRIITGENSYVFTQPEKL